MSPPSAPLYLATTNPHKRLEVAQILAEGGLEISPAPRRLVVEEDGATFAENARKKALAYALALGAFVLADDSGLEVPALGGEPGVLSARYAGSGATAEENNRRLIQRLEARALFRPAASFVCHAALATPQGEICAQAEGRVEGLVIWPGRGTGGFGYDPLFFFPPAGKSFAELTAAEKNAVSHRGRAFRALHPTLVALL